MEPRKSEIILIGLNHKTAPVALRECIAFTDAEAEQTHADLKKNPDVEEVVVYSTCNRVEIVMVARNRSSAVDAAVAYISTAKQLPVDTFKDALYMYSDADAVRHLFRVAASLDSMIIGEPQILGQIKAAYRMATQCHASGVLLNRLLHRAFFVAKKIRSETGIGDSAVSISYAATELARKIFGRLEEKNVLLIGAGEMAELAVEHLMRHRVGTVTVANRTFERGVALAERFKGNAIKIEEMPRQLQSADIVIASTGAPGYVVTAGDVKKNMRSRRNRPVFFIDIAVPRDIDPDINRINNAYVYDIDDLKGVIDDNIDERKKEAVKGERIIEAAAIKFQQWRESLEAVPTIVALQDKLHGIFTSEMEKTLHGMPDLPERDRAAIQRMGNAIIKKILHDPAMYLKRNGCHGDMAVALDVARKLFHLDEL